MKPEGVPETPKSTGIEHSTQDRHAEHSDIENETPLPEPEIPQGERSPESEQIRQVRRHLETQSTHATLLKKVEKDEQMRTAMSAVSSEHSKRMDAIDRNNEGVRKAMNRVGALGVLTGVIGTFFITGYGFGLVVGGAVVVTGCGVGRMINAIRTRIHQGQEQRRWDRAIQEIRTKYENMPDRGY
ncbi:MAG TPA: hypothetical protein PK109_02730 [Candidatus Paceibacterota bacterium]|nr:hypothetical protein [Candidatus Paceibacterota bacterium]